MTNAVRKAKIQLSSKRRCTVLNSLGPVYKCSLRKYNVLLQITKDPDLNMGPFYVTGEVMAVEVRITFEPRVSDQVRHKPGCTTTEDGKRLETAVLRSIWILLSI